MSKYLQVIGPLKGEDGKSAYQYAQDGGYTGTEAEFAEKLAAEGDTYTLPVASSTILGGVQPVAKTDAMTQSVGVDEAGALFTEPGGGGSSGGEDNWETLIDVITEEEVTFAMTELQSPGCFKRMAMYVELKGTSTNTANKGVVLKLNNTTIWSGANNLVVFGYNAFFGTADKKLYGTILFSKGGTISAFFWYINITYFNV